MGAEPPPSAAEGDNPDLRRDVSVA